jgi:hypothetical protein
MKQSRGNARTFSTPATDHISRYAPFPPPPPPAHASIHGCGSTQEIEKSDHSYMKNLTGFLRLGSVVSWQTRHVFLLRLAYIYIYIYIYQQFGVVPDAAAASSSSSPSPPLPDDSSGATCPLRAKALFFTLLATGENLRRRLSRACLGNWTFFSFSEETWRRKKGKKFSHLYASRAKPQSGGTNIYEKKRRRPIRFPLFWLSRACLGNSSLLSESSSLPSESERRVSFLPDRS